MEELLADGSSVKERMITHYPQLSYKVNIVYIPTFREGEKADLDVFEKNIDFTRFNFIARVHPKSEVIHSGSNVLEANLFSTYDWMHLADIIVTDYSSLALEAAVMSKKLYFYLYDFDKYSLDPGLNINIFEESIGRYAFTDIKDFDKLLREEYDYTALREFRDKYVEVDIRKGTEELTALLLEKR